MGANAVSASFHWRSLAVKQACLPRRRRTDQGTCYCRSILRVGFRIAQRGSGRIHFLLPLRLSFLVICLGEAFGGRKECDRMSRIRCSRLDKPPNRHIWSSEGHHDADYNLCSSEPLHRARCGCGAAAAVRLLERLSLERRDWRSESATFSEM